MKVHEWIPAIEFAEKTVAAKVSFSLLKYWWKLYNLKENNFFVK